MDAALKTKIMPASAHTAPSRDEPQPKFSFDRMMGAPR